jgi:hypothetical protein
LSQRAEVEQAVVVIIAPRNAVPIPERLQACRRCYVDECAVALISLKRICSAIAGKEDIHEAIVVAIREQRMLQSALEILLGAEVSIGQVYHDYTPPNLLFENDQLSLVDPPDVLRHGVLLWDFSCFRSSMRRHLWRFSLRRLCD